MGVLTHLDEFKTAKALRASKKMIKHRFWTEIYQGAKIFHFNGIVNNKYLKNECKQVRRRGDNRRSQTGDRR